MNFDFDIIIIGSGPAGVSAAFPLVDKKISVCMLEGGEKHDDIYPNHDFLKSRKDEISQWKWMIGDDYHYLKSDKKVSPKLKVPNNKNLFNDFNNRKIVNSDKKINIFGGLGLGGLSKAWGCGVSSFTQNDLKNYPIKYSEIQNSYYTIAKRIGLSGSCSDDLSEYYDLDDKSEMPINIGSIQNSILNSYKKSKKLFNQDKFNIGISRLAVLSQPKQGRLECNSCGNCLWGCSRKSMYNSEYDIELLNNSKYFSLKTKHFVEKVICKKDYTIVKGKNFTFKSKKVILAAGTLSSTQIALNSINYTKDINMYSCPSAAFAIWFPKFLGKEIENQLALSQLSFTVELNKKTKSFGSIFNSTSIPTSEFIKHISIKKKFAIKMLEPIISSVLIGNVFLPGDLTKYKLNLDNERKLFIKGNYDTKTNEYFSLLKKIIKKNFKYFGGIMLPKSFKIADPGSDIHYSGTLPMKDNPILGETNKFGLLKGTETIYLVDGSILCELPSKPHTFFIMSNAHRIGKYLSEKITF